MFEGFMENTKRIEGEAGLRCREMNKSILLTARVPKLWAVVVRRPVVGQVPSRV